MPCPRHAANFDHRAVLPGRAVTELLGMRVSHPVVRAVDEGDVADRAGAAAPRRGGGGRGGGAQRRRDLGRDGGAPLLRRGVALHAHLALNYLADQK